MHEIQHDATVQVVVSRDFNAPAAVVYDAWLDPACAAQWFFATPTGEMVHCSIDAREGGAFCMTDRRDGEDVAHMGTYLVLDRPRCLVFTFCVPKYSKDQSRVTVEITPRGSGCTLTLTQEMPAAYAEFKDRSAQGWAMMLSNLDECLV